MLTNIHDDHHGNLLRRQYPVCDSIAVDDFVTIYMKGNNAFPDLVVDWRVTLVCDDYIKVDNRRPVLRSKIFTWDGVVQSRYDD